MERGIIFIWALILIKNTVSGQDSYIISGKINDSVNHQSVAGATIRIKGASAGAIANEDGSFQIRAGKKLPVILVVTSIGFKSQEFTVDANTTNLSFSLNAQNMLVNQVVVTASRRSENILRSPVTIEKLDLRAIKETPSPGFYDALKNIKGVQMTTLSMLYQVPNTRGFAGTTNSRFLQMVDGVDNISPGIGAPIGNAVGPTELDIESVELVPGASSALYGLNAVNGIANLKTKSPFDYEGISVYEKTGVNHINEELHKPALFTEYAVRYAKVINKKFAFKLNAGYTKGTDWIANNFNDQYYTSGNNTNAILSDQNPGADLINRYGDEYNSDMKTLILKGKNYDISRTGYFEKDLTDYTVRNLKLDGSFVYKPKANILLSYIFRIGDVTNNYQRGNRVRLDGEIIQQHALEFKIKKISLKAYYTSENTGNNSFNFRPLGENIDLAFKKPSQWYNDFTKAFNDAITNNSVATSLEIARAFADNGRFQPGTHAFDSVLNVVKHTNNWDTVGAQMLLKSAFYHIEGQYDLSGLFSWVQLLAGFNYRNYIITPDGNNYVNPQSFTNPKKFAGDFNYYNFGGFIQATKTILKGKVKLTASLRADRSEYFDMKFNPRIAAVYSPTYNHNFRISFQNGYRFPTLFEGFAFVNNGGVRRLGGLPVTSQHLEVFENSYLNSSVTDFKNAVNYDKNNSGIDINAAIRQETYRLKKSSYNYIQPEHVQSTEIGYKAILFQNKLFLDIDYYFTEYKNFIGQLDVTQPFKGVIGDNGGINDSTAFYVYNGGKQVNKYKMWTNSKSVVTNQGIDLGLSYSFLKSFNVSGNVSFAGLVSIQSSDAFTPAFNTPSWMTNISVGNREIFKNTGFNIVWHWQSSFYWNSPLAQGDVPSYGTVDAQINHRIPELFTTVKLGATNILNHPYYQYLGGPTVGGFYYVSFLLDVNKQK